MTDYINKNVNNSWERERLKTLASDGEEYLIFLDRDGMRPQILKMLNYSMINPKYNKHIPVIIDFLGRVDDLSDREHLVYYGLVDCKGETQDGI